MWRQRLLPSIQTRTGVRVREIEGGAELAECCVVSFLQFAHLTSLPERRSRSRWGGLCLRFSGVTGFFCP